MASRQLKEGPTSLANEFNKKILEKGSTGQVFSNELPPEAAKYLESTIQNKPA